MMKTVILAGGRGTRLSEETGVIPKPLVEIAGKPLLWYIMKTYSSYGYNEFIVAGGYKCEKLKEYFINLANTTNDLTIDIARNEIDIINKKVENWKVTVVDTGLDTFTGGRIKKIKDYVDDIFMLTYGDGVADINLGSLIDFHKSHGGLATITAVRMPRFGILNIDKSGKVLDFQEKRIEHSPFINGGFMVLSKKVMDYIQGDEPFEIQPMLRLIDAGELFAYKHEGFWHAVDTIWDKRDLEEMIFNKKVKLWKD